MQVKTGELLASTDALKKLAAMPLRGAAALRVARVLKAAQDELATYEEARVALVKRMGAADDNGGFSVTAENLEEFATEIREMQAVEITLPGERIALESLGDALVTAGDMMALDWLFSEE